MKVPIIIPAQGMAPVVPMVTTIYIIERTTPLSERSSMDESGVRIDTSNFIELPINPEEITFYDSNKNTLVDIVDSGETVIQGLPSLRKFTLNFMLWHKPTLDISSYSEWTAQMGEAISESLGLETSHREVRDEHKRMTLDDLEALDGLRVLKRPIRFVVFGDVMIDMDVVIDNMETTILAGEEDTRYLKIDFTEYKEYGAKVR